ncbi:glycosyltransferase [Dyella nitratireducens]|uniref:Glycosyl transferase n=1 Tax=Dyella nitratireducens TaxID=1849580 RepID=A0ABQ1FS62_9GAMM|nr:glycosyltransferase [Dyella nitratireducens]GGA28949.1 glycosyl transferase [Dyella nitratireducens]GLQ43211.1 glycosyl transferase [Dyella nitratireducens]
MPHPDRCQLIARDNGAGLSRDLPLLAHALQRAGCSTHITGLPHRGRFAEWLTRMQLARKPHAFDVNVMLERIRPEFLRAAKRSVLIPNPEYFRPQDKAALPLMDAVWVKTRHAERLFQALGANTRYIGFTSADRYDANVLRQHAFFHGPGRSGNKGTQALLALWRKHPEWPMLTVAWRRKRVEIEPLPANVTLIREHLSDAEYRRLQNEHRFHLCPSQTEGFGHYVVEAMSCHAVVVTLDAEPMNELVTGARGVLVAAHVIGTQDLATTYGFTEVAMEAAIERCLSMDVATAEHVGHAARAWYERNHAGFADRLREALHS